MKYRISGIRIWENPNWRYVGYVGSIPRFTVALSKLVEYRRWRKVWSRV